MDVVGYAEIRREATTDFIAAPLETFQGKVCRVMEFDGEGGALVVNNEASGLAHFDEKHILRKFECTMHGDVICPPNMSEVEKFFYTTRCMTRKGGYGPVVRQLVIGASLTKGKFTDSLLWALQ